MPYTITRQVQWPDGDAVVDISAGGTDATNPDALAAKYHGEFEEFISPVEAVDAAIAICKAWRQDGERQAKVGHGATGGMTMPFDTTTFAEARKWAKEREATLPRCHHCGQLLGQERYTIPELDDVQNLCICFLSGRPRNFGLNLALAALDRLLVLGVLQEHGYRLKAGAV